jgi:hypothetical protein
MIRRPRMGRPSACGPPSVEPFWAAPSPNGASPSSNRNHQAACLLDLWPRGRTDTVPNPGSTSSLTGAAAQPSTFRSVGIGGTWCRSGTPRRRRIRSVGGSRPSRTGHATHDLPPAAAVRLTHHPVTCRTTAALARRANRTKVL